MPEMLWKMRNLLIHAKTYTSSSDSDDSSDVSESTDSDDSSSDSSRYVEELFVVMFVPGEQLQQVNYEGINGRRLPFPRRWGGGGLSLCEDGG